MMIVFMAIISLLPLMTLMNWRVIDHESEYIDLPIKDKKDQISVIRDSKIEKILSECKKLDGGES